MKWARVAKIFNYVFLVILVVSCLHFANDYFLVKNFKEVVPHKVYTSGQPSSEQMIKWIKKYHIKTIVNLRGLSSPCIEEEQSVAEQMGVELENVRLSAYELIPCERLSQLIEIMETAETPMLVHCSHGVDRAGTVGALAAWFIGNENFLTAKRRSFVLPGPWKRKKSRGFMHISDTLDLYDRTCKAHHVNPDSIEQFKRWAATDYIEQFEQMKKSPTLTEGKTDSGEDGSRSQILSSSSKTIYIRVGLETLTLLFKLINPLFNRA